MSAPPLNPEIQKFFSNIGTSTQSLLKSVTESAAAATAKWTWWHVAATIALALIFLIVYLTISRNYETPDNIRVKTTTCTAQLAARVPATGRKSLKLYKEELRKGSVSNNAWVLGNLYIATVNGAGLFFPARDGVFSPEAVRLAAKAGARGFVFDIWPDLAGAPVLQAIESGSLWRRISMNALPFDSAVAAVITAVFGTGLVPTISDNSDDFVVLYLRFRGEPTKYTYDSVAAALRSNMEQYRLPAAFNSCKQQDTLVATHINQLAQKVIIVSNMAATDSRLADYINMSATPDIVVDASPQSLANGQITQAMVTRSLTFVAPAIESDGVDYDWEKYGYAQGASCLAVNYGSDSAYVTKYLSPEMFGTYSYRIKPVAQRSPIKYTPIPDQTKDQGTNGGVMSVSAQISP